jgi:hypothetical protein
MTGWSFLNLGGTEDETFLPKICFSDEVTFHLSGKVNRRNISVWGSENPHAVVEHSRDSPKINFFVLWAVIKCTDLSSSGKKTVN